MSTLQKALVGLALVVLGTSVYGAVGYGVSNTFTINNRDSVTIKATNNWDGTVTVEWDPQGKYNLIRKNIATSQETGSCVSGKSLSDSFELSELQTSYKYYLLNSDDTSIDDAIAETAPISPEIIIVLVRGYNAKPLGNAVDADYWTSNLFERLFGLVPSVSQWFEDRKITCWDASSYLNGTKSTVWNADRLEDYLDEQAASADRYQDAKLHLFGHSMGGLYSRQFAYINSDSVLKIFCAQTPHTGSPAATVYSLWPCNEATEDLKTDTLKMFNNTVVSNVPIYATYSTDYREVMRSRILDIGADYIRTFGWINHSIYSDGIVPVNSAKGTLYDNLLFEREKVRIADKYDSSLDHSSCYRHERVLNKIINSN